jgi:hypothetical protein
MALTLEKLRRLERVMLVEYFESEKAAWTAAAKDAYAYIRKGFGGEMVRPDDVQAPLKSVVEIDQNLRAFLNGKKLSQKYWISDFTELVIDRTWDDIAKED